MRAMLSAVLRLCGEGRGFYCLGGVPFVKSILYLMLSEPRAGTSSRFNLQLTKGQLTKSRPSPVQSLSYISLYVQNANFIQIVGVRKRGAYELVHGDQPRQHSSFGATLRFTGLVPADSWQ